MSVGWLGCTVEIYLHFTKEKHARWAYHVAEDMIKLLYAPTELPWVQEASNRASLSERYLNYQQYIKELDLHPERDRRRWKHDLCALDWLERRRTHLIIERCADIARTSNFEGKEEFFPQLCFAIALRFPQVPFSAISRYEMMVTGSIQCVKAVYDGSVMHVQEISGERPFNEDDWSRAKEWDYIAEDGVFTQQKHKGEQAWYYPRA